MRLRALVVGAVTRDLGPGRRVEPGGVVTHAGLALASLGAATRVVTRVHSRDGARLLAGLRAAGVEVLALPSRRTTTYLNDYGGPVDRHRLLAVSDPITPDDVPAGWREADLVHLGPLHARDLLPETARALRGFTGLDLQGLVRVPRRRALRPVVGLRRFLDGVDVVQASEEELAAVLPGPRVRLAERLGAHELIVTRGASGALVLAGRRRLEVRALPVDGAAPGAGDVFLAAYLFGRASGEPPRRAARGAAHASAHHVAESVRRAAGTAPRGV
jgi:sugar/nucleoside kinase (ribokinase family)